MLVLSRRPTETIVFPPTGISVEVLEVRGATVKIGVTAPTDVKILRGEVQDRELAGGAAPAPPTPRLRDDLEQLSVLLHLYRGQHDLGRGHEAELTLARALALVAELRLKSAPGVPATPRNPRLAGTRF